MKKWIKPIIIVGFPIFALVLAIRDFVASDGFRYFAERQSRLLLVISIGVIGGLLALVYERLTPHTRHIIKLCAWGSGAIFSAAITGYCAFASYTFLSQAGVLGMPHTLLLFPLLPLAASIFYSLSFYHSFKRRTE